MGGNGKRSSTPCLDSRLGSYSLRTDTSGDPVNSIECGLIFRRKAGDSLIHLNYGIQSLGEERERRKQGNKSGRATPHQLLLTIIRLRSVNFLKHDREDAREEERRGYLTDLTPRFQEQVSPSNVPLQAFVLDRSGGGSGRVLSMPSINQNEGWLIMVAHSSSPGLQ